MDGLFYIKNVTINKNLKLENISPINVAVIASELKSICERTQTYLQKRISDWYDIAIANDHDYIILGAIGCGAFKESDEDVEILSKQMKICADKYKDKIMTTYAIFTERLI